MTNPIKPSFKTEIVPILCLIISLAAAPILYLYFPARVATHWNIQGVANGYSSRAFAAFFFPGLIAAMYLLFLFLPVIDPRRSSYSQFAKAYHIIKALIVLFMTAIYAIIALAALGHPIAIDSFMPLALGVLFIILGNYLSKLKPNWFIGIRTPWTIDNDVIWRKTHQLGGKLFVLAGIVSIVTVVIPLTHQYTFSIFIGSIIAAGIIPVLYSLYLYYQQTRTQK